MKIQLNNFVIGSGRAFVIAEIGNNHNGSYDCAIEMIDRAIDIGVDCVKFQMRHLEEVYRKRSLNKDGEDLGTEYILDLLNRFELSVQEHRKLFEYCSSRGIMYLCTPWDAKSIEVLEEFNVSAYKVASADLTNLPLLDRLSKTGKPLIISTGMSKVEEIQCTANFLNKRNIKFVLLHCNSTYPAPLQDINLRWMDELKKIHPLIGYSGHERGINVSLAAIAFDACVIERHLTLDRGLEGPDHAASLTYTEFKKMLEGIRDIETAMGSSGDRDLSQGEMINRENLAKSLVSTQALTKGTTIAAHHIQVRSPGQGLSPQKYESLVGRILGRDMDEEDFFYPSDLTEFRVEPREYSFSRPWGVPVRYHDFKKYYSRIQPDLLEFHLSYTDMELDLNEFLSGVYDCELVVHAPELFANSKLMDLATPDEEYRKFSILETQRVIDITRSLKQFFPKSLRPMIVANIGGFSMDEPLPQEELPFYYERFLKSLKELDMDGVEIIPQTMAPFPWHFGGQRYQNIFIHSREILKWARDNNMRICFDVSHTKLACNYYELDFYGFAEEIAPVTAHIHMGDAKGLNGEGLQIGEGEIDFTRLGKILKNGCPAASFIPEIWQGHKDGGSGFWLALDKLESTL